MSFDFVLADSADPGEMPHCAAFHLGLLYLSLYQFRGWLKYDQRHTSLHDR